MNFRKLIVFFLIFSSLSYYYFHVQMKKQNDETVAEFESKRVLSLDDGDVIKSISVEKEAVLYTLKRLEYGKWRLTQPVSAPVQEFRFNGLLTALRTEKKVRDLSSSDMDLALIGLKTPVMKLTVDFGDKKRTLVIGETVFTGDNRYAMWEDNAEVFIISSNLFGLLNTDAGSLRSRNVFNVTPAEVAKMTISFDESVFELSLLNEDSKWWITKPFENIALEEKASELISSVTGLKVAEFVHDLDSLNYGFDSSRKKIDIALTDTTIEFIIGNKTEDGASYYGKTSDEDFAFLISAKTIDALMPDPVSFIDKRVNPFEDYTIQTVSYATDDRQEIFVEDDTEWKNSDVLLEDEKAAVIERLISVFSRLEYVDILSKETIDNLKENGYEDLCRLEFKPVSDEGDPAVFSIYTGNGLYIVTSGEQQDFFTISKEQYDSINDLLKEMLS